MYRLFCPKGIFLRSALPQCLVYWIYFQNTYFYISKNITSNTFVAFKIADRLHLKFITVLHQFINISHKGCSYGGELARLGGLAHLDEDDFYLTFMWNLLSQFNQKVCYVAEKRLFDKVVFTINSDVKPLYRTMFLYCLINIRKTKQSWLKKTLSHLAGLAHLRVFIWKIFISPRWDPGKIKRDPN